MDPTSQQLFMGAASGGSRGTVWTDVSPTLTNAQNGYKPSVIRDVLYISALNVYIAVGGAGTILRSTDGISWTTIAPPSGVTQFTSLRGLSYSPTLNKICAVGTTTGAGLSGQIIISSDGGLTWTTTFNSSGHAFYDSDFGNGSFVVVGEPGRLLYSLDGNTWIGTAVPSGASTNDTYLSVSYGTPAGATNGRWAVVGVDYTTTPQTARFLFSDTNGGSWTNVVPSFAAANTYEVISVAWVPASSLYVCSYSLLSNLQTGILTSTLFNAAANFTNIAPSALPGAGANSFSTIKTDGTNTLAIGAQGTILRSTTPATAASWVLQQAPRSGEFFILSLTYNPSAGRYILCGFNTTGGFSAFGGNPPTGGALLYTSALSSNSYNYISNPSTFIAASYKNGTYCFVANSGLVTTTTDFVNWTEYYLPVDQVRGGFTDPNRFIVFGAISSTGTTYIYSTTDFVTWSADYSATGSLSSPNAGVYIPGGTTGGGTTHVIVGSDSSGRILTSTNGTTWTVYATLNSSTYRGITYTQVGGVTSVVAIGNSNALASSSNPNSSWTTTTIPTAQTGGSTRSWSGIATSVSTGQLVITADNTSNFNTAYQIMTSPINNLSTWTARTATGSTRGAMGVTATNNGTVVAVGYRNWVGVSYDTVTWAQRTTPTMPPYVSLTGVTGIPRLEKAITIPLKILAIGGLGSILISYK